jgi:hypothetical protein
MEHGDPRPTMAAMTHSRIARITTAWGLLFAVAHFYWAVGGEVGMGDDPADTLAAQLYIGFIAVLGLVGAAVAQSRGLTLLKRTGAIALLLGVAFGTGKWLSSGTLEGDGAEGIAITLYFLLGGVLFSLLGWGERRLRFC